MIWIFLSGALFLSSVSCGTEYLLDLEPTSSYVDIATVYLGQKLQLKATASFAEGQTTQGVIIELLPSVGSQTVFAFSEIISYTKGGKLVTSSSLDSSNFATHSDIVIHKGLNYADTTLRQRFDDRAEIFIGQVQSTGSGTEADNQIEIVFEVVYVDIGDNVDGDEYKISVGEEYDNGQYIWISQTSVILKDNAGIESGEPVFELNSGGDNNIAVGEPKSVSLTMEIPRAASALTVEAVVVNSTEEDVFVKEMKLTAVGEAYAFSTVKENIFTIGYDICPPNSSMVLDLGTPINKEVKESPANTSSYQLVVETVFQVENASLVGGVYTVGFGISIGDTEIWVSDFDLTVVEGSWTPFATFTVNELSEPTTISPGFHGGVEIILTIPKQTNHVYNFVLSTQAVSAAANVLSILAITPISHGNNIPCSIPNSAVQVTLTESISGSGVFDQATWSVNISNTGMQPSANLTADSDQYTFQAYVMLLPEASQDEQFTLSVDVNGVGSKTVAITAGGPQAYATDLNYTFSLDTNCPDNVYSVGSTIAFYMTVVTERSKTAGNMTIEFPIPENGTSAYLKYKSARVISKGANVVCVPLGTIPFVLSDWEEGSGENDRAVLTIPLVCNFELDVNSKADEFMVELVATFKDVPEYLDADTDQAEFAVGVSVGDRIWVSSYGFQARAPVNFTTTKRINGVIIRDGQGPTSWPGDLRLQWSYDNRLYHDFNYNFLEGSFTDSQITYPLDLPLYARYARLVNTDNGVCTDYTLDAEDIGEDIKFFGSESSRALMLSKIMYILDNDNTTCMSLPTVNTSDSAKFYWTTISTQALGSDGLSPFNLLVTGNGLTCDNAKGPQVTKVMHPKDSSTLKFTGNRKKCTFVEEISGPPVSCKYTCSCSDNTTCADVSLLLYFNGSPDGAYEICDIQIVP